jgi:hypothetical protein
VQHRQLYAEIRRDSEYSHQASKGELFPITLADGPASEHVVVGGPGGQYRLKDVNLYIRYARPRPGQQQQPPRSFLMKKPTVRSLAFASVASLTLLLAACGGGGSTAPTSSTTSSGSTSTAASSTIPAGTTQASPSYPAGSVQAAMFAQINAYRTTCGFPAVQQNTLLDQAAANHANYMVQNGDQVTDDEVQGKPGFTGVTGQDRANALGWPAAIGAGTGSTALYNYDFATGTAGTLTPTEMGQGLVNKWATGVYHQFLVIGAPINYIGLGVAQTTNQGFELDMASEEDAIDWSASNTIPSGAPLTFPCQGVSGISYGVHAGGEIPAPPNTSANGFGTPVAVMGNLNDQVMLTKGSMVNTGTGATISLNILNANNDPNKELYDFQSVAYPAAPLSPNTAYQVDLTGTINGNPFSRSFTFTTGNVLN